MELTKEQLKQLLPKNPYIDHWHHALSILLPDYEINTPKEWQHLLHNVLMSLVVSWFLKRI
jgi:hypothetical protein